MTYSFDSMPEINGSYAIDFKELKRVGEEFCQVYLDHGMLLNPHDKELIETCNKLGSKVWLMSLYGEGNFCNPSAENIAKEIFLALDSLFAERKGGLKMDNLRLYETPNCYTDCTRDSITSDEAVNFYAYRNDIINAFKKEKGIFDYDARTGTCDTKHIQN